MAADAVGDGVSRSRHARVEWGFPSPRLVQGVELWLPLADPQQWTLRSLRVKACGVRVAVRAQVEVAPTGVRIQVRPARGRRWICLDQIVLRGNHTAEVAPSWTVVEPRAFVDLRAALVGRDQPVWLSVGNGQGYGDIVHCLLCQWLCFRLVGVELDVWKGVLLLLESSPSNDREKQVASLAEFVAIGSHLPVTAVDVCAIKGLDVDASSLPLLDRIGVLLADFAARLHARLEHQLSVPVTGGVRVFELLLDAFGSSLHKAARWERLAGRLAQSIQDEAVPRLFPSPRERPAQESSNADVVVCQQRLGDLAVVTIEGLELVPWFLEQDPDRYFQVLAAASSRARRPASSLLRLREYAQNLHPGMPCRLITDGYGLAERLLLKPSNRRWIADRLGRPEDDVDRLIRQQIAFLHNALEEEAGRWFSAGAVIGDSTQCDLDSLHALQACSACVSTSGHFCFTILNYLSRRPQVLHAYPMGKRFDLLREGLVLRPLSPADLQ